MKVVKRIGVFETNSSSTHSMVLLPKEEWQKDCQKKEPKYRDYYVLDDPKDKLYMACGCCEELFDSELAASQKRKESYAKVRKAIKDGDEIWLEPDSFSWQLAVEFFVKVYCDMFGEEYTTLLNQIIEENKSGRPCHMRFFCDGALRDAIDDYGEIYSLFYGDPRTTIEYYLSKNNVLVCREEY